ncbi:hypothetical protein CAEBREN_15984 [Caenorhabditis brenneri]|uniref:Uncharacterized protein n=1 Tax=Caenorhabditis brenneri TaxID=135651 RepID=G0MFJ0_CAEBE|nr:hypothetical protein CAEBREN_15984 [Caenorhabditis brenneri]
MQDGAKTFKRRATQTLEKANVTIEEAYKLLSINEREISVDNFTNKIKDLLIDKEKLYELEEEIPSIVEDDDGTSPEEKQQILKSLKDHVIPSIRKLVKEIEEAIGHLERRVNSMRTKTHTWSEGTRAPGEQSTINNKDAPSSNNQQQRSRSMPPRVSPTHRQERNTEASERVQQGTESPGVTYPSNGNKRLEDKMDTLLSFLMSSRGNVCNIRSAPTLNDSDQPAKQEKMLIQFQVTPTFISQQDERSHQDSSTCPRNMYDSIPQHQSPKAFPKQCPEGLVNCHVTDSSSCYDGSDMYKRHIYHSSLHGEGRSPSPRSVAAPIPLVSPQLPTSSSLSSLESYIYYST